MKSLEERTKGTGHKAESDKVEHIEATVRSGQISRQTRLSHWSDSEWECRVREQIEAYSRNH